MLYIYNKLITFTKIIWILCCFVNFITSDSSYHPYIYPFKSLHIIEFVLSVFHEQHLYMMYGKILTQQFKGKITTIILKNSIFWHITPYRAEKVN